MFNKTLITFNRKDQGKRDKPNIFYSASHKLHSWAIPKKSTFQPKILNLALIFFYFCGCRKINIFRALITARVVGPCGYFVNCVKEVQFSCLIKLVKIRHWIFQKLLDIAEVWNSFCEIKVAHHYFIRDNIFLYTLSHLINLRYVYRFFKAQ